MTNHTAVASEEIVRETAQWIPRFGIGLLIVLAFLIGTSILSKILERSIRHASANRKTILILLVRTGKNVLIFVGFTIALGTMGINVSAMVAGLGLTGFALGFALKDAISNVISGVMILLYHTFQVDDFITTAGFEGQVIDIDLRYTIIKSAGKKILIPNSMLVTNPIVIRDPNADKVNGEGRVTSPP